MNVIEPLFERQFIFDSYANRIGKGTHKALDRTTHYLRRYKYVMHLDIRQFFPAIDHEILLSILSRTIKDEKLMILVKKIISSGAGIQASEYDQVFFSGDTLFSANRSRGLPIGNLTSQNWANVYLNELDQYVKRELKCRAYLRYVDDFLLFANDKKSLRIWRKEIISFLEKLRLTIHENKAHLRPCHTGVSFLGFQVFPEYRRLKPANGYAYQRRLKKMVELLRAEKITEKDFQMRLQSWINHADYGDTFGLRKSLLINAGIYGGNDE
jgi:retron-type reverse transcriptase